MTTADFTKHPSCDKVIYLSAEQCDQFGTSYRGLVARCCIAASTLLASKDYDEVHSRVLAPIGSGTILLKRQPNQFPGWFTITRVVPA